MATTGNNPRGNPETLKPWKPGQSGNPGGRPRKRPLSESYDDWLRAPVDPATIVAMREKGIRVPANATNADMVARAMGRQAITGNVQAAKEMGDRTEGKATQRVELVSIEDRGIELHVIREERALPPAENEDPAVETRRERTIDVVADAVTDSVEIPRE